MTAPGSHGRKGAAGAERLWSASFTLILVVSFLGSMSGNGVNNGVTLTLAADGGSTSLAGIILGVFCFSALVSRFISGTLSDRYGRKRIILLGCVFLVVGSGVGMVPGNPIVLLPSRMLMAVGFAMVGTATGAAVADIAPKSRVGEGLGYQSVGYALSVAVGPGIAVNMAGYGRTVLFGVFGAMCLAALLLTLLCRFGNQQVDAPPAQEPATATEGGAVRRVLDRYLERKSAGPAIVLALASMPLCIFMSYVSVFAAREAISGVTAFFAVAAVMMILVRAFAAKAFDRFPPLPMLIPSCLLGVAGLALLILSHSTVALIATGVLYGIAQGATMPLLISQGIKRAPATRYGAASATMYIGCDTGIGIGSIFWGITISALGFTATYAIGIVILLVAIIAALVVFRRSAQ